MEAFSEKEQMAIEAIKKVIQESKEDTVIKNMSQVSDDILIRFIRGRDFDIQSAAERLLRLGYCRRNYPEVFSTLYPSALRLPISKKRHTVLKNRDQKGRHVYCIRVDTFDPEETSLDDMIRTDMIMGWEMTQFKETQVNGIIILVDCTGFTLKQAMTANPMLIKKFATIILKGSAVKIKGAHIINAPSIFTKTLTLVKVFLPRKLRNRIYVHEKDMKSLHEWISPDILPEWAGGNLSEDEAYDKNIYDGLLTPEKDEWYKTYCTEIK